jgi:hypothetical protein
VFVRHIFRSRGGKHNVRLFFANLSVLVKTSNRGQAIITFPQHSATINAILSLTTPHITLSLHPHQQRLLCLHTNDRKHTSQQKQILAAPPYKQEPKRFTTMPVSTAAKIVVAMLGVLALLATRRSFSEMESMDSDIEYESIQVSMDILSLVSPIKALFV